MLDRVARQQAPPIHTWSQLSVQGALRLHHFQSPTLDPTFAWGSGNMSVATPTLDLLLITIKSKYRHVHVYDNYVISIQWTHNGLWFTVVWTFIAGSPSESGPTLAFPLPPLPSRPGHQQSCDKRHNREQQM